MTYGAPAARPALRDVELAIGRGERIGLCGPSGAGKSSLLLVAAGLLAPTAGEVVLEVGLRIGLCLQEPEAALFARTVRDELAFAPQKLGWGREKTAAAVERCLALTGLSAEMAAMDPLRLPPAARRLVSLGAVLAGEPPLLLLDEPTVGLDAAARLRIISLIRSYAGTVVVSSHDLDLLWRTCERVVLLNAGRKQADTSWRSLVMDPEPLHAAGLRLPEPLCVYAQLLGRGWRLPAPGQDERSLAEAIAGRAAGRGGVRP